MIPAENKREKALELAKEGKGAAEIARLIDAKYSTVYSWLNPDKCKKPKPENKTGNELFSADQCRLFVPELSLQKKGSFEIFGICFTPDAFCTEGRGIFSADE